jgi:hypothetical protein
MAIWKVVCVSPSDVQAERDLMVGVIQSINRLLEDNFIGDRLRLFRFEEDVPAGFHELGPQALADANLPIADCDILIGIFWQHFGAPTLGASSGTEHEIRLALDSARRHGRPEIKVFFSNQERTPVTPAQADQLACVLRFKEELGKEVRYANYLGPIEFGMKVQSELLSWVFKMTQKKTETPKEGEQRLAFVSCRSSICRRESITDPIGPILLRFLGVLDDRPIRVRVVFNSQVTCRLTKGNLVRVWITHDNGYVEPVVATLTHPNSLLLDPIQLRPRSAQKIDEVSLTISGIRVNSSPVDELTCYLEIDSHPTIHLVAPFSTVASVQTACRAEIYHLDGSSEYPHIDRYFGLPTANELAMTGPLQKGLVQIKFQERCPRGFRTRKEESEFGQLEPTSAETGTILGIEFYNIPRGLVLLVPTTNEKEPRLKLRAVSHDQMSSITLGGVETSEFSANGGMVSIPIFGGGASVFWEWISDRNSETPDLAEVVVAVNLGTSDLPFPDLGLASFRAGLCPHSTVITAASRPLPRFVSILPLQHAFTICEPQSRT